MMSHTSLRSFHLSGGREMVDGSKATKLVDEVIETDPQAICLSNKSFDAKAAEIIADKLKNFTNVSVVDISDIIAGRPEDEALMVLEIICKRFETLLMPLKIARIFKIKCSIYFVN